MTRVGRRVALGVGSLAAVVAVVGIVVVLTGSREAGDAVAPTTVTAPDRLDLVLPGWLPEGVEVRSALSFWQWTDEAVLQRFDSPGVPGPTLVLHTARVENRSPSGEGASRPKGRVDGATVRWFDETRGPSAAWMAGDQTVSAQFSGVDEDKARDLLGHLRYREQPMPTGFEIDASAKLEPVTEIRQRAGAAPAVLVEWRDDGTQKTVTLQLVSTAPESYELLQFTRPGSPRTLGDRDAVEQVDGSPSWLEPPATSASLRLSGVDDAERDRLLASLQRSDNGALAQLAQAVAAEQALQSLVAEARTASLRRVAGDVPGPQDGVVELRRPVGTDTDGAVLCLGLAESPVCGAAAITSATGVDLTVDNPTTTWHAVVEIDGRLYLLGTTRATTTAVVVSAGDRPPLEPVLYEDPSGRRWYAAALPTGLTRASLQEQDASGDSFGSGLLIPRLDG